MWAWCMLNLMSWFKRLPTGVVQKFGKRCHARCCPRHLTAVQLRGPPQNSSRGASERGDNINKLSSDLGIEGMEMFKFKCNNYFL
ncbi:hypothetical protein AVEN_172899-1 [Araneus ventricosus]|uniref:Secreted protein n=1 Tax=Araneus ventricosus TaxID=182803 RepID=A0A4Y2MPL4_ARAVE|nr:hypothetical protein AVEN_172899-1 [Araneus ventricosus]